MTRTSHATATHADGNATHIAVAAAAVPMQLASGSITASHAAGSQMGTAVSFGRKRGNNSARDQKASAVRLSTCGQDRMPAGIRVFESEKHERQNVVEDRERLRCKSEHVAFKRRHGRMEAMAKNDEYEEERDPAERQPLIRHQRP